MIQQSSAAAAINRGLAFFLVLLPVISFLMNLISWLRFGIDIPFLDDMRQYASDGAGRMDWDYIMSPANDTLYPIGLIFDALAFRLLDGNSVAYQTISMVAVLGGILFFQWRLLSICTSSKIVRAMSFAVTVFMLQPDSYWGWQNMAFHQAIPALCSLWIIYLVLSDQDYRLSALSIFVISIISGFTYTSGAFANLSILVGLCIFILSLKKENSFKFRVGAMAMLLPTVLSVTAQLWVLIWVQHGTHRPDAPMAYPWESDFWYFLLGKIGRSLLLPMQTPDLSISVSATVFILSAVMAICAIVEARRSQAYSKLWNSSVAYLCIFGVVLLYLFIISAGRANLRPDSVVKATDIFIYGYARFHFFWVCLLWPWLIAFLMERIIYRKPKEAGRPEIPILVLLFLFILIFNSKVMSHSEYYRTTQQVRVVILKCLTSGVSRGVPFECPDLHPGINMLNVYYKSLDLGASYAQLILKPPTPLWSNDPPPLYRLTENKGQASYHNTTIVDNGAKGVFLNTAVDSMIEINVGNHDALKNCNVLQVNGSYDVKSQDLAQLFYLPAGVVSFSQTYSEGRQLSAGGGEFSFEIHSKNGFNSFLRFDPAVNSIPITLKQLEVRCAVSAS
ncbi:Membrane protein [Pseudomonas syringae pv. cilantro]|uniref:Membrane protein n=2 Tax=Pseudomonas syringae group TaxID=136849 RepID=A0A0N0GEN4_PSESX|nr:MULTISPECIES: hypothetical protein [Pseudomonas syringae group]KPC28507.1 Membrane protein [Pseudomonas syringae pv. cilantro]